MEYTESSQQFPGQAKRLATENPPRSSSVSLDGRLLPSGHCCHICQRTQLATVCESVGESADRVALGASAVSLVFIHPLPWGTSPHQLCCAWLNK